MYNDFEDDFEVEEGKPINARNKSRQMNKKNYREDVSVNDFRKMSQREQKNIKHARRDRGFDNYDDWN